MNRSEVLALNELTQHQLGRGHAIRFIARGRSMWPSILDGDRLTIAPTHGRLEPGHIVCVSQNDEFLVHRVVAVDGAGRVCTQGDALPAIDGWFDADAVLGRIIGVRRFGREITLTQTLFSLTGVRFLAQCRRIAARFRRR